MTLIRISLEQIAEFVRLSKAAFDSDHVNGGPPGFDDMAWHEKMYLGGHLFAAMDQEQMVGGAILFFEEDTLYIGRIFVNPDLFRQGYGSSIMASIENMNPQIRHFCLDTPIWNNRTNSFYQSIGYTEINRDAESVYYQKDID